MQEEIIANEHKGPFDQWLPSPAEFEKEIEDHLYKLYNAIANRDVARIQEHSADVANIAERAYSVFGYVYNPDKIKE